MSFVHVDDAVQLVQMEYAEMPGLTLTFWQAQRLWNLPVELCEQTLTALTTSGFLTQTPKGAYVRNVMSPVRRNPSGQDAA
jgi:hypothetical protein